jgi:hypothetical protein
MKRALFLTQFLSCHYPKSQTRLVVSRRADRLNNESGRSPPRTVAIRHVAKRIVPLPTTTNTPTLLNYATNTNPTNPAVSPSKVPGTSDYHEKFHQLPQIKQLARGSHPQFHPIKCLALIA